MVATDNYFCQDKESRRLGFRAPVDAGSAEQRGTLE